MASSQSTETDTPNTGPTIENPTAEFLDRNFTKTQLQKHGRDLGVKNVWIKKNLLIEQIMEKHQMKKQHSDDPAPATSTDVGESVDLDNKVTENIDVALNDNGETVNSDLSEQMKKICDVLKQLCDRVTALESGNTGDAVTTLTLDHRCTVNQQIERIVNNLT
ncbi:hypothetical protein Pcinc_010957 [Petrolisthes cinctipes]|uniref:Uncharacterized protein n=1 Tax=Petrolisthes cinctipes TaxID=88211 RepID=A0AAE1G3P8_PETCI|nr:hypothetical protein Pcinc_010957 [Petrolisthes cinctipes]